MDENLVKNGLQIKNKKKFEERYKFFESKELRDTVYDLIEAGEYAEEVGDVDKVTFIIRVETEY